MKVTLADPLSPEAGRLLSEAGFQVANCAEAKATDLRSALQDSQGLIVRSATQVTADLLAEARNLKVVGRAGSGVDNIDVQAATLLGILVLNAPGENTLSAAEHTMAMLLGLCRKLAIADSRMRNGEWNKSGLMGVELYGKTLGVLGLGRIGRAVAERARAFEMEILGYDPYLPPQSSDSLPVSMVSLEEILQQADFLTLHIPAKPETRHILDTQAFKKCKAGMRLVNCSRGGTVDEAALFHALEEGAIAGAALDVFEQEPLPADHPLRAHPRVLLTPHLGASTEEAQQKVAFRIARQVVDYLQEGIIQNAVNVPSVDAVAARGLRPYQKLAEVLGSLQARLMRGNFQGLRIETRGEVAKLPAAGISASVLKGFLGGVLSQPVNVVNALALAETNGFPFTEVRERDAGDFASLVTVVVETQEEKRTLSGTLFGQTQPRLVRVDEFLVDAEPKGTMLWVANQDSPGRLAAISSAIADFEVNIANLSLGRIKEPQRALALFNLDAELPPMCLEALRKVDGVEWVQQISLSD